MSLAELKLRSAALPPEDQRELAAFLAALKLEGGGSGDESGAESSGGGSPGVLEEATRPALTLPEGDLPYHRHPAIGFLVSRTLTIPGFVPPTAEESAAIIERADEEEDLRRAGLF
jgi:hypothetical protein